MSKFLKKELFFNEAAPFLMANHYSGKTSISGIIFCACQTFPNKKYVQLGFSYNPLVFKVSRRLQPE